MIFLSWLHANCIISTLTIILLTCRNCWMHMFVIYSAYNYFPTPLSTLLLTNAIIRMLR
uniref:Uncharacterized protein n=1 Tax=Arundo donax TaxID=35708 RepID=A0A0A9C527_ARUDO